MKIEVRSILQQALDDLNTLASAKKDEEIYIDQMEAKAQVLLNYIADLQRKEYNNSKAIEYIHEKQKIQYKYALSHIECDELEDILEKGE